MKIFIQDKKFAISVHEGIPVGPHFNLKKFLLEQPVEQLLFIAHPLTYEKEFYKNSSRYELYKKGKQVRQREAFHWRLPDPLLYAKDLFYTLFWCIQTNTKYELFFGVDPLNALAGLFLSKLGRVEKVVYYTIDYFTPRFENKILNFIYHTIDKICVRFCDETWNLSSIMAKARENYNAMPMKIYKRQYTVPVGVWFNGVKHKDFDNINKKKIIFTGYLNPLLGVDLILRAMPKIIKKIPHVELEIIGGGQEYEYLQKLAYDLKIKKHVTFHGWIADREKVERLLSDAAIGLAPFNTKIAGDKVRNADPAKLKDYARLGLPFIVTDAIANPKEIMEAKCGIVIRYNTDELANAVLRLLTNEKLLKEYRANALKFIQEFDNEKVFATNIQRVLGNYNE